MLMSRSSSVWDCVHALHHFDEPQKFVHDSSRFIRTGGALAIIGMDPNAGQDEWYLYDYFPGTYESDVNRYPSGEAIKEWLANAGFGRIESWMASRIQATYVGRDVFSDRVLHKNGTSQLSLLSEEEFEAGMARIRQALASAETGGPQPRFVVDIHLSTVVGWKIGD
jgi:hypothetical protein